MCASEINCWLLRYWAISILLHSISSFTLFTVLRYSFFLAVDSSSRLMAILFPLERPTLTSSAFFFFSLPFSYFLLMVRFFFVNQFSFLVFLLSVLVGSFFPTERSGNPLQWKKKSHLGVSLFYNKLIWRWKRRFSFSFLYARLLFFVYGRGWMKEGRKERRFAAHKRIFIHERKISLFTRISFIYFLFSIMKLLEGFSVLYEI